MFRVGHIAQHDEYKAVMGDEPRVISEEMRLCATKDVAKRSLAGAITYLLVWFAIIIPEQFYLIAPRFCVSFSLLFLLFSAIRVLLFIQFDYLYGLRDTLWLNLYCFVVWVSSSLWGIFCAMALILPEFSSITIEVVIATAGFCGGGLVAYIPNKKVTVGFLTGFMYPPMLAVLLFKHESASIAFVFAVFWFAMLFISRIHHQQYWFGLSNYFRANQHAEELEELNTLDGLTGLKNRMFFDKCLSMELKMANRSQTPLAMFMMDIDHFKKINDEHGHLAGDECLKHLSRLFKQEISRQTDVVARYGGEEFAVILADTSKTHALALAERLRERVEHTHFQFHDKEIPFTISIGISVCIPEVGHTNEQFIEQADIALYKAKTAGRNQVCA